MATITISDNDARVQYTQAVVADTTQLTIDFPFFNVSNINVIVTATDGTDTSLSRGTGAGTFAVVGTAVDDGFSGGYVTLGDTYSDAATKYTIFRDIEVSRTTDFPTSGPFNVSSLNTELDKIFAIEQELQTSLTRTVKLADSDAQSDLALPNLDTRKGTVLAFNETTGIPEAGPEIGDVSAISAITADISTLADIEDGTDATDAIQTVAGISGDVSTVSGISGNVTTVAGISADVTSVASDASDIGTVSSSISDVNTIAGISSNVTTVAGISANVTTVAGDSSDIQALAAKTTEIGLLGTTDAIADMNTLATADIVADLDALADISANITSVADIDTDVTSVAGISANVTTVAGNNSNVSTVAGVSSDVTTVAGISANVTTVANDGTDIGTVAGISSDVTTVAGVSSDVTTVAGIAADVTTAATNIADITAVADEVSKVISVANDLAEATSEIDVVAGSIANVDLVGGSISNVNSVATNIADVNSFADTYFISATAPSSPTSGDLWFDTSLDIMKVYGSGGWQNAGSSVNGTSQRAVYIVGTSEGSYDGSTTVFPITYDTGYIDVYLNGIKLDSDIDFTATNGTSITLTDAATSGDTVDMVAFGTFSVANFSVGDANNVDLSGLADDQFLQYNSTSGNFEPATIATDVSGDTTPQLGGDLDTNGNDVNFGDSDKAIFGAGDDLQIYHNGTSSFIEDTGNGDLFIRGSSNVQIEGATAGENMIYATENGAVRLYYDAAEKLATTSTGVDVTGRITTDAITEDSSGNLGIGTTSPSSFTGYSTLSINNATNGGIMNLMVNGTETARLQAYSGIFNIAAKGASTNLTFETNGTERMKINADGSWGKAPAGTVLQVKNGLRTSSGSMTVGATANVSIPSCQVTITPTSSSSKFLIFARVMGESSAGNAADMGINIYRTTSGNNGFVNTADADGNRGRVLQNLSVSYDASDAASTPEQATVMVLDSPATTNSITYNVQIKNTHPTVSRTWYINRVISTANAGNYEVGSTEIVVQEIAG